MNNDLVKIIREIEEKYNLGRCKVSPASLEEISDAETYLNLKFTEEYKNYLLNFFTVFFPYYSMFYLKDVIMETETQRDPDCSFHSPIPPDMYAIRPAGDEGECYLQDKTGSIYYIDDYSDPVKQFDSLMEYILVSVIAEIRLHSVSDIYIDYYYDENRKTRDILDEIHNDIVWFKEKYDLDMYEFLLSEEFKLYISGKTIPMRENIEGFVALCGMTTINENFRRKDEFAEYKKGFSKRNFKPEDYEYYGSLI